MAEPVIAKCPSCQQSLQVPPEMFGQQVACPFCQHQFSVGDPAQSAGAPGATVGQNGGLMPAPAPQIVTATMAQLLRATRPWVLFLAIIGFIACGLMVVAGLFMLAMGASTRHGEFPAFVGIIYIPMAVIYFFPAYFLLKYSGQIKQFLATGLASDMESALAAQKSFWRFVGILTVVVLVIYAIALLLVAVFGVFAATRHSF